VQTMARELAGKDEQVQTMARELAGKDEQVQTMARDLAGKDEQMQTMARELAALRREVRGVEVHDVEAGVIRVEERGDQEPPAKRVRREQDARKSLCQVYQARLVEVKKEHKEEGERRQSAMKSAVDATVKEKLAEVAQAFECACCFEIFGERSVAFAPCGHTYCNRASCPSACAVECPECREPVAGRVVLFGALGDVRSSLAAGGATAD
jgi:hypothetical protein